MNLDLTLQARLDNVMQDIKGFEAPKNCRDQQDQLLSTLKQILEKLKRQKITTGRDKIELQVQKCLHELKHSYNPDISHLNETVNSLLRSMNSLAKTKVKANEMYQTQPRG